MQSISIKDEYAEVFSTLGDLQSTIDLALQRYAIEKITQKINELRQQDDGYAAKYGMGYTDFSAKVSTDIEFVNHVEHAIEKTWEIDLANWEFCHRGIEDWMQKLQTILLA
ncbi:hypothetical protein C7293_29525 [filamentous cyanobacterium CCT1]|nr:hypothetical protein C7293_29525 [filamentous cyanobacterium CCT1]PSN76174.1 hypothetical protein C8B47_28690 [filamentous cyanobacterium CCP4]